MSIKKVGAKGVYQCDFYPAPGAPRVRQSLHTTDKGEAQRAEARLKLELEQKVKHREEGGITLAEAFKHTWRVRDDWRSSKSPDSINKIYAVVSKELGEDTCLSKLSDEVVTAYGEGLIDSGLSASTVNKRLSMINVLFEEAIKAKKYQGIKPDVDHYKVKNGRRRLISTQEESMMIALLREYNTDNSRTVADLIIVLADTGARISEGLNILPSNIYRDDMAVLLRDTKNGSDRIVPLTERALEVLLRRSHSVPMFHPLNPKSADYYWDKMREKAGLAGETEFVIHALRHTFGSTLANAGVDAFRIKQVMGHKSMQSTERYVKVSTASLTGLADIMAKRTTKVSPKVCLKDEEEVVLGYGSGTQSPKVTMTYGVGNSFPFRPAMDFPHGRRPIHIPAITMGYTSVNYKETDGETEGLPKSLPKSIP